MSLENLPLPFVLKESFGDSLNFKFYRSGSAASNVVLSLNNFSVPPTFDFLPSTITPSTPASIYINTPLNNIIENVDTTSFKFNKAGLYEYDIVVEGFGNTTGILGLDLVSSANVQYKAELLSIKNVSTVSSVFTLKGVVHHNLNDVSKLRFGGFSTPLPGDVIATPPVLTFNISSVNINIKSSF